MPVEVAMTLMYMCIVELGLIFVERNQLSSRALKESQEDQDLSHLSQLMRVSMGAQQQSLMWKLWPFAQL